MLLLDSVFINNSGGKVLLDYLVRVLESNNIDVFYLFDKRCENDFMEISEKRKVFIKGSLYARHRFYKNQMKGITKVFCFGNVPPSLKLKIPTYTYFHNVSLFYQPENYSFKERVSKFIKGRIIAYFSTNTDFLLVQTNEVKILLTKKIKGFDKKIFTIPFFETKENKKDINQANSFVYISNGNTHKNHVNLLAAWDELAARGLFPELHLTVTENFPPLLRKMEMAVNKGVKIINHGYTDPYLLYASCRFLIYPSFCESFGLGLIEAVPFGCEVVASDLPYVHEVVVPTSTFDPFNPRSIADSVENVLATLNLKKTELVVKNQINRLIELLKYETTHTVL